MASAVSSRAALLQMLAAKPVSIAAAQAAFPRAIATTGAASGIGLASLVSLEVLRQAPMTIAAKYEDGVFKPLEDVKLTEGTRVEVHVGEAAERPPFPKSLRELAAFGMWADRDDIPDGMTYVNRLREPRF